MNLPAFSPNILIICLIVATAIYGAMAGKHHLRRLILSVYVGIVLATELAAVVVSSIHQPVDLVTLCLFFAPILIFGFSGGHGGKSHQKGGPVGNLLIGVATGALIAASALKLLPPSEGASVAGGSLVGTELMMFWLWLVALVPVVTLLFGLVKTKEKH